MQEQPCLEHLLSVPPKPRGRNSPTRIRKGCWLCGWTEDISAPGSGLPNTGCPGQLPAIRIRDEVSTEGKGESTCVLGKHCAWAWPLPTAGGKITCDTGLLWNKICQARRAVSEKKDEDRNWLCERGAGEKQASGREQLEMKWKKVEQSTSKWHQVY